MGGQRGGAPIGLDEVIARLADLRSFRIAATASKAVWSSGTTTDALPWLIGLP